MGRRRDGWGWGGSLRFDDFSREKSPSGQRECLEVCARVETGGLVRARERVTSVIGCLNRAAAPASDLVEIWDQCGRAEPAANQRAAQEYQPVLLCSAPLSPGWNSATLGV